jgi:hypothetical protein
LDTPSRTGQPPGPSWPLLGPPGPSWALLGPPGPSWALLGPPGPSWALLGYLGPPQPKSSPSKALLQIRITVLLDIPRGLKYLKTSCITHQARVLLGQSNVWTNRPTDQPTNRPTNQPTNQLTNQPTDQPTNRPTDQPTNRPTDQLTKRVIEALCSHLKTFMPFFV